MKLFQVDIDANGDEVKYTEVSWLDLVAKEAARLRQVKRNSPTFLHQFIKQGSGLEDALLDPEHLVWIRILLSRSFRIRPGSGSYTKTRPIKYR
jgi:hypothetical protein